MTNHFDEFDKRNVTESVNAKAKDLDCRSESSEACSSIQRDRFELLSAYLDGEVTAAERRQVDEWLASDAKPQRLYSRLLSLRQGLQALPVVKPEQSVDQLVDRVAARIERRPRRLLWGGLAIAALFMGALVTSTPRESYAPSIAHSLDSSDDVPSNGLMIALNHPPIEIPKAAISAPAGEIHRSNSTIR